jgi:hypothetical protein
MLAGACLALGTGIGDGGRIKNAGQLESSTRLGRQLLDVRLALIPQDLEGMQRPTWPERLGVDPPSVWLYLLHRISARAACWSPLISQGLMLDQLADWGEKQSDSPAETRRPKAIEVVHCVLGTTGVLLEVSHSVSQSDP